jgi:hypothetical protein
MIDKPAGLDNIATYRKSLSESAIRVSPRLQLSAYYRRHYRTWLRPWEPESYQTEQTVPRSSAVGGINAQQFDDFY